MTILADWGNVGVMPRGTSLTDYYFSAWDSPPAAHTRPVCREHRDYLPRGGDYFTEGVKFDKLVSKAKANLADVDFDTFVATGLSGSIPGSVLAYALGKHLLVIRKDDDTSTHSSRRDVGVLGRRWVFLDDFMSSGRTFKRVWDYVEGLVDVGAHAIRYDHLADETVDVSGFTTDFVGAYLYDNAKFKTPREIGQDEWIYDNPCASYAQNGGEA